MPWRDHPDPYAVWVSEIMLQQTRVETVIPYFHQWMKKFPHISSLANAAERDVLKAWEGLGYYSRARNLHKASKIVASRFNGQLPRNLKELRTLPGIGRYTAAAIASFSFAMDEPALDGNLKRVLSRVFDLAEAADSPAGEKKLWELARQSMPKGRAGDFNQALMDLGATICLPKKPRCLECPLQAMCQAWERGTAMLRPVLKARAQLPQHTRAAAVIVRRGRVLIQQRPAEGLLGGLWEFPNVQIASNGGEHESDNVLEKAFEMQSGVKIKRGEALGVIRHAYSHFRVLVHVYQCRVISMPKGTSLRWIKISDLATYPMGKIDRKTSEIIK